MTKTDPSFSIKNVADLTKVEIKESSEGRSFGRRFTVEVDGVAVSEAILFRDIFDDVKAMAKQTKNQATLREIVKLLNKLDKADIDADGLYKKKDKDYRFLTWVSRLLSFGSHHDRIEDLKKSIKKKLDPAKQTDDKPVQKSTKDLFDEKNYDLCLDAIKAKPALDSGDKDLVEEIVKVIKAKTDLDPEDKKLAAKIADMYLTADDPEKGLETIKLIKGWDPEKAPFLTRYAEYQYAKGTDEAYEKAMNALEWCSPQAIADLAEKYYQKDDYEHALDVIYLYQGDDQIKDAFKAKVAEIRFENKEYELALEAIAGVGRRDRVRINLTEKILNAYIENKEYKKALMLLNDHWGDNRVAYAIKLGNACFDSKDFTNAHDTLEFIRKDQGLFFKKI